MAEQPMPSGRGFRAGPVAECDTVGVGAPSGTVTFLFTDVEGSTRLWESAPSAMGAAMARHDELVRSAVQTQGGYVFSTGGDGFGVAFARAGDAIAAAVGAQGALAGESWPAEAAIEVRMGLHTGEADERDGDYFGSAVNRAARLMAWPTVGRWWPRQPRRTWRPTPCRPA
jgi:class 3 adenylate cyclase